METRTRKAAAKRREETARAVLRILGEKGITALTTSALSEAVGVSSGALFRHFPSRDAMLDEAVTFALVRVEATFPDPALPPLVRLQKLAESRIRLMGGDAGIAWLFGSEQAALCLPAKAVRRLGDIARRSKQFILTALTEGVAEGSVRGDIDPEILLVPVMGTIHTLIGMEGIHDAAIRPGRLTSEQVLAALWRLLSPVNDRFTGPSGPTIQEHRNDDHQ